VAPTTTTTSGITCVDYYAGAYLPTGTYLGKFRTAQNGGPTPPAQIPQGSWYILVGPSGSPSQVCSDQ